MSLWNGLKKADEKVQERMRKPARNLLYAEIDAALNRTPVVAPTLIGPLLKALMAASREQPNSAVVLDVVLDAARGWARKHGLSIRPLSWSFARPSNAKELVEEETAELPPVTFADEGSLGDNDRVGDIELIEFGWVSTDRAINQAPRMHHSAGRRPLHYDDLRTMLGTMTKWPAAAKLLAELDKWPQQRVARGDLRSSAQYFFDMFYDAAGAPPRLPEVESCARLLDHLLRDNHNLNLKTFPPSLDAQNRPASTNDYKGGWITKRIPGTFNTGRITQVIRPGLCSTTNELIFPAVVDVE